MFHGPGWQCGVGEMRPLAAALPGFPAANVLYVGGSTFANADNAGNVHQFQRCYMCFVPGVGSMLTPLGQAVGVMRLSGQPEQLRCAPNFPLHPHVRPLLPPPSVRQGWRLVVWYTGISCVFVFYEK